MVFNNLQVRQLPKSGSETSLKFPLSSLRTVSKFCLPSFKDSDIFYCINMP